MPDLNVLAILLATVIVIIMSGGYYAVMGLFLLEVGAGQSAADQEHP